MINKFHTLYFEATRKCNFNCEYCSSGSNGKYDDEKDMDFDTIVYRVLKPAHKLGTRFLDLSGGEFLLRPDAFEILDLSNKMGFRIGIASNGSLLNESTISKLKTILGDNLIISLGINSFDDKNIETRDVIPDYTMEIINRLESHNINMNICVTMGAFNAKTFSDTYSEIKKLILPHNRIPYVPRNADNKEYMFDKEIMRNYLHPVLRKYYHGYVSFVPFFLPVDEYEKVSGLTEKESQVPLNPSVGCWCGSFYGITPNGDVSPCPLLGDNVSGGNVNEMDLYDILYNTEMFKRIVRRDKFEGKCGECRYRYTCGGCRAYTYFMTGNLYGSDPTCFIEDLTEQELIEMEKEFIRNFRNYKRMAKFGNMYIPPENS